MKIETKFKIGDRVKYIDNIYGDSINNPLWGGSYGYIVGTVDQIEDKDVVCVAWDNKGHNSYRLGTLELVSFDWDD